VGLANRQDERKDELRRAMSEARAKTLRLLDFVPDEFLKVRVHDFYSPVGWHFGHIGMTEEFWVCSEALCQPPRDSDLTFLFANLPDNPKDNRVHLPSRDEIISYLQSTRCDALEWLDRTNLASSNPLIADGYAWDFALQHECQHQETICELLQLIHMEEASTEVSEQAVPHSTPLLTAEMISIPGGTFTMGSNAASGYDNEKSEHEITVADFELDMTPVTVMLWIEFMLDGGYTRRELWSEAGWNWRQRESANAPEYWRLTDASRGIRYYGPHGRRAMHVNEPVSSISWFEADAYARWAGKRLPTEAEWEYAARFDPATGRSRRYPWGESEPDTNRTCFGMNDWRAAPVGDRPTGASAFGIHDMAGGVWEWTSTPFLPYPGFKAYPYDGYSKDHMDGKHYVCKGGSWATSATILRSSFRNWYVPTYRQGFLGLRCAR
jgi:iron(II)-dependent oxidoreductase